MVHRDEAVLKSISSLENYIVEVRRRLFLNFSNFRTKLIFTFQELNVRCVTVTRDKQKYGVFLRAEPDHKILGSRLKSDFKNVMAKVTHCLFLSEFIECALISNVINIYHTHIRLNRAFLSLD